jgi:hypothetical protein
MTRKSRGNANIRTCCAGSMTVYEIVERKPKRYHELEDSKTGSQDDRKPQTRGSGAINRMTRIY